MHLRTQNICIILINYDAHEAYKVNTHTCTCIFTQTETYTTRNQVFLITKVTFSRIKTFSWCSFPDLLLFAFLAILELHP